MEYSRTVQELWSNGKDFAKNCDQQTAKISGESKKKKSCEMTKKLPRTADKCPVQEPLNERQDSSKTE